MDIQNAIDVRHPREEYAWLGQNPCACGGSWELVLQALVNEARNATGTRMTDRLRVCCATCGSERDVYFAVTYRNRG
jgi:hypothetical protein